MLCASKTMTGAPCRNKVAADNPSGRCHAHRIDATRPPSPAPETDPDNTSGLPQVIAAPTTTASAADVSPVGADVEMGSAPMDVEETSDTSSPPPSTFPSSPDAPPSPPRPRLRA